MLGPTTGTDLRFTGANPERRSNGGGGDNCVLAYVNIQTTSTSASLALYKGPYPNEGTPSTTGTLIGNIDCSTNSSRALQYMIRCRGGLYGVLTPAATGADVSITIL